MKKSIAVLFILTAFTVSRPAGSSDLDYSKALILKNEKKYAEAIEILDKITNSAEQYRIYYQISECYLRLNNFPKCIEYAQKAVSLKDDFSEAYIILYNAYNAQKNYQDSADVLFTLTELNPDNPEYLYTLGLIHYSQLSNMNMAKWCFDNFINISYGANIPPQFIEKVHIFLSDICFELELFDDAVQNMKSACEYNQDNRLKLFRLAGNLASQNRMSQSVDAYEYFVKDLTAEQKANPFIFKIYAYLGSVYYATGNPKAIDYLLRSLGDKPADSQIQRALFLELTGHDKESLEILDQISAENDKYFPIHIALGKLYERSGNTQSAGEEYLKAGDLLASTNLYDAAAKINLKAGLMTGSAEAYRRAAQAYDMLKMPANAVLNLQRSNKASYNIENDILAALIGSSTGDTELFQKSIESAKRSDPSYARIYYVSGLANIDAKKFQVAEKDLLEAIRLAPDESYYKYHVAALLERKGEHNTAIKMIEDALKSDPEDPSYQNFLGYLYADNGVKLDDAERMITSALAKEPFNGAFLDSLGWVYYKKGNYSDALTLLNRARQNLIAIESEDPAVYDHIGDTYAKLGNKQKAVKNWEKSLSLEDSKQIRKKIEDNK